MRDERMRAATTPIPMSRTVAAADGSPPFGCVRMLIEGLVMWRGHRSLGGMGGW